MRYQKQKIVFLGQKENKNYKNFLLVLFPFLLLFLCQFWQVLFQGYQFSFRDGGYFYYVLFEQIQKEFNLGNLPLWDPCDNLGFPLMENPTSSVFYPLKLIFFATALFPGSFGVFYKFYILIHYPIAYWGIYRLAQHWKMSLSASVLSAVVYTFTAPFFFQYCNVIYLIGGAWFPYALLQGDNILRKGGFRPVLYLAFFLSLMVLGGDPQLAYLTGVLLCVLTFVYWRAELLAGQHAIYKSLTAIYNIKNKEKNNFDQDNESKQVISVTRRFQLESNEIDPESEMILNLGTDGDFSKDNFAVENETSSNFIIESKSGSDFNYDYESSSNYNFSNGTSSNFFIENQTESNQWPYNDERGKEDLSDPDSAFLFIDNKKDRKKGEPETKANIADEGEIETKIFSFDSTSVITNNRKRNEVCMQQPRSFWKKPMMRSFLRLAVAGILGIFLSAAAVFPSIKLAAMSERTLNIAPHSIWEIPRFLFGHEKDPADRPVYVPNADLNPGLLKGLFCQDYSDGTVQFSRYSFSLPPWDLAGLCWPNITGNSMRNYLWTKDWPNVKSWIPSLYLGILPFLFILLTLKFKGIKHIPDSSKSDLLKRSVLIWCSWIFILAVLVSLGAYSPVWIGRAVMKLLGSNQNLMFNNGDPIGGVYWLMTILLPFFSFFRYPAKFTLLMALAAAFLAGFGWDRFQNEKKLRSQTMLFFLVSMVVFLLIQWSILQFGNDFIKKNAPADIAVALLHPCLILLIFNFLLKRKNQSETAAETQSSILFSNNNNNNNKTPKPHFDEEWLFADNTPQYANHLKEKKNYSFIFSVILLVSLDLLFANFGLVSVNKEEMFHQKTALETVIKNDSQRNAVNDGSEFAPPRFYYYDVWIPKKEAFEFGREHNSLFSDWQYKTLFPKYSYSKGIGCFQTLSSTMLSNGVYQIHKCLDAYYRPEAPSFYKEKVSAALASLDIRYIILDSSNNFNKRGFSVLAGTGYTYKDFSDQSILKEYSKLKWPDDTILWKNNIPSKRISICRNLKESSSKFWADKFYFDFTPNENGRLSGEQAKFISYKNNKIELEVFLSKPGSVVLAEQYWPGWTASVRSMDDPNGQFHNVKILREKNVFRRMDLPAGHHHIIMQYRSSALVWGVAVSAFVWMVCLIFLYIKREKY